MDNISPKEFNMVSQLSHFAWGMLVVTIPVMFHAAHALAWIIPLWVGYSAIKEFWYDEKYENPSVRGSSLEDFCFQQSWIVGIILYVFSLK